ncbi:hypothetical protein WJX74_002538 [Apatococcus lobatus]|uniref:Uncharacterized protein n=1 Tax=Apatococcus lobatus TaxID=904363 RepID=A0AAW1QBG6_9CHLO
MTLRMGFDVCMDHFRFAHMIRRHRVSSALKSNSTVFYINFQTTDLTGTTVIMLAAVTDDEADGVFRWQVGQPEDEELDMQELNDGRSADPSSMLSDAIGNFLQWARLVHLKKRGPPIESFF